MLPDLRELGLGALVAEPRLVPGRLRILDRQVLEVEELGVLADHLHAERRHRVRLGVLLRLPDRDALRDHERRERSVCFEPDREAWEEKPERQCESGDAGVEYHEAPAKIAPDECEGHETRRGDEE